MLCPDCSLRELDKKGFCSLCYFRKIDKDKDSISNTERLEESIYKYLNLVSMGTKGKLFLEELKIMKELITFEIEEIEDKQRSEKI